MEAPTELVVTITGVDLTSNRAMVVDGFDNEIEVDLTMIGKATGLPDEGERWIITKRFGRWTLDTMLGAPSPLTITGSRDAMDPTLQQVIDALAQHGLIYDATTGGSMSEELDLNDENDPEPEAVDVSQMEEYDDEQQYANDGYVPPMEPEATEDGYRHPHRHPDPHGGSEHDPHPKDPSRRYSRLSILTYNTFAGTGPIRARADWQGIRETRTTIACLQECNPHSRDDMYVHPDWDIWRPTAADWGGPAGEVGRIPPTTNPIVWRTKEVEDRAKGVEQLVGEMGNYPARYATWVRFKHKESGLVFTVINTHLDTKAARNGVWDHSVSNVVDRYRQCMTALIQMVRTHGTHGPVFLAGDFNYHWESAVHKGFPEGLPRTRFRAVGMHSNWSALGMGEQPTRHGSGWIDYIWLRSQVRSLVIPEWQRVLHGYYSDHLPVLVTYKIRNRGAR